MANELNIASTTGRTLTARLIQAGAYVGSAISLTESPASSGFYTGSVVGGTSAGTYEVIFLDGSTLVGSGRLFWSGSAEIDVRTLNTAIAAIASGVRTELTTELGRIDVAVSSRLATAGYTTPPTTSAIALAVESQLADDFAAVSGGGGGGGLTAADVWSYATRSLTDKAGFSLTQSFPANFAALGINASGHLSRVTLVDTTTTNTDMRGTDNALLASSYVAPPSTSAIATAVESQLADEFAGISGGGITAADVWSYATRSLTDKSGFALTQTFPANFAALGINASGHVSRVTLVDTTTTNTDMRGTNNALLATSYTAPDSASAIASAVESQLSDEFVDIGSAIAAIPTTTPLDASGIRTAVGLTNANLDTQLGAIATSSTAIKTKTDNLSFTGTDIKATLDGETVTVGTNNDKTGYSLTQAFPTNFASLGINASGHIQRVTLVDTTTVNTDMRGTNGALLAVNYTVEPSVSAIATSTEFIEKYLRADEEIRPTTYTRFEEGTSTVLIQKAVTRSGENIDLVQV